MKLLFQLKIPGRLGGILLASLCLLATSFVSEAVVITSNDPTAFQAALNNGGLITFTNSPTFTLTNTLQITNSVIIDGTGFSVVFSGNNAVRVFSVTNDVVAELINLTVTSGKSTNGAGIFIAPGAIVTLTNCIFSGNSVLGTNGNNGQNATSNGDDGHNGGPGKPAVGGAIYNLGTLSIFDCTISGNKASGGDGGTGGNGGSDSLFGGSGGSGGKGEIGWGGGIYSAGSVFMINTTIKGNQASGGDGKDGGSGGAAPFPGTTGIGGIGETGLGGGIYNLGTLVITNCTFATNNATGGDTGHAASEKNGKDGGAGNGGAIYNLGVFSIGNSTFTQNFSRGGKGGDAFLGEFINAGDGGSGNGGAIYHNSSSTTNPVVSATFATNNALGGVGGISPFQGNGGSTGASLGGSIYRGSGQILLRNTILVKGTNGANCSGTIIDSGFNISSDASCAFTANYGSRNNINARLDSLEDNGGKTFTMALLDNSPAIDMGDTNISGFDQRGLARPQGSRTDIGALEFVLSYSISGRVFEGTNGLVGIKVNAGSRSGVSTTNGYYTVSRLPTSSYVVAPTVIGAGFNPSNQMVMVGTNAENPVAGLSASNINFTANPVAISASITFLSTNQAASNRVILLKFAAMPQRTYKIQSSTNLTNWINISTNLSTSNASFQFATNLNLPKRFFRAVAP